MTLLRDPYVQIVGVIALWVLFMTALFTTPDKRD